MDKNILKRSILVIGLVALTIAVFAITGCKDCPDGEDCSESQSGSQSESECIAECGDFNPPKCYNPDLFGCCGSSKTARTYILATQDCCGSGNSANPYQKASQCCENGKVKDKCGGNCCPDDKPFCKDGSCNKCPDVGWEECSDFCCNTDYDKCSTFPPYHCVPKDECNTPGMKKCDATVPKCCKEEETCGVSEVSGINVAVCLQGGCATGEEPCDVDADGKSHCCKPPKSKCEQLTNPTMKLCIAADENECEAQGLQYCKGVEGRGARCCTPGTCFLDGYGAPKCSDE